jgi:translation elongation factor EF-Tu-like GTPase
MSEERMLGRILNFNVGVLGHVDSGKTSLARALSTVASTAAFDKVCRVEKNRRKNPIKRERCHHNAPRPLLKLLILT